MTWPGDRSGGWTRIEGDGRFVDVPERPFPDPVLPPAEPFDAAALLSQAADEVDPDDIATEWPDVADQPITAFCREVLGFEPWPRQAQILDAIYALKVGTSVLRLGRRSGKGRKAAIVATYEATANAAAHLSEVPKGEQVAVVVVATSQKQARVIHRYIRGFLKAPALAHLVVRDTDDEIELSNGMIVMTMPCTSRSTRGIAVAVLIMDEAAWFLDGENSPLAAKEIWDALAPATAQFPAGRRLILSTPRWVTGWFSEMCRTAASGEHPDMRHWWATTAEMNPRISQAFLDAERAKDPASFAREYEARFTAGLSAVFPDALVRAAIDTRIPRDVTAAKYVISVDASSGTGKDTFALTSGYLAGGRLIVRDVTGWRGAPASPINHRLVYDSIAALARELHGATVIVDQWAGEVVRQALVERGCTVVARPWSNESKAEAVSVLRELLHGGLISIPDHGPLVSELVQYEERRLPSGRPHFAAPPGQHDDFCAALMGLAHQLRVNRKGWGAISGAGSGIA